MKTSPQYSQPQLKRVGGWLLLFFISLTFLNPIVMLANIADVAKASKLLAVRSPVFSHALTIDAFLYLGFAVLSAYVGVILFRQKANAVSLAKSFLICYFLFAVARLFTIYLSDLTGQTRSRFVALYAAQVVRIAIYTIIWYWYLSRSVRVKTTYQT